MKPENKYPYGDAMLRPSKKTRYVAVNLSEEDHYILKQVVRAVERLSPGQRTSQSKFVGFLIQREAKALGVEIVSK